MAGLNRRVETFTAGYVAFDSERTAFTTLPMQDMDSPPQGKNFALSDRTKQYLGKESTILVYLAGVLQSSTLYTLQRLGAFVRFLAAVVPAVANPTTALTPTTAGTGGTIPAGVYAVSYAYVTAIGVTKYQTPAGTVTTTGSTSTITTGAAPALPTGATSINWYVSSVAGGGEAALVLAGNTTPVTGITITALPAAGAAAAPLGNNTAVVTMTGESMPTYFLKGARALANTRTSSSIDTTGSGDVYQNAVPGRPSATISFTLVTGSKITNKAGKLVTIENALMAAADAATCVTFAFVDDTTDPLQPRDTMFCYIATGNKTRAMGAVVERMIDATLAVPDDGSLPLAAIDYIA